MCTSDFPQKCVILCPNGGFLEKNCYIHPNFPAFLNGTSGFISWGLSLGGRTKSPGEILCLGGFTLGGGALSNNPDKSAFKSGTNISRTLKRDTRRKTQIMMIRFREFCLISLEFPPSFDVCCKSCCAWFSALEVTQRRSAFCKPQITNKNCTTISPFFTIWVACWRKAGELGASARSNIKFSPRSSFKIFSGPTRRRLKMTIFSAPGPRGSTPRG